MPIKQTHPDHRNESYTNLSDRNYKKKSRLVEEKQVQADPPPSRETERTIDPQESSSPQTGQTTRHPKVICPTSISLKEGLAWQGLDSV